MWRIVNRNKHNLIVTQSCPAGGVIISQREIWGLAPDRVQEFCVRHIFLIACSTDALLSAGPAGAWAQDSATPVDVVVVTSGPLGLRADELVGSNDVVTQRDIEDNLAGSLADTISREPGVSTTFFGPAASRPVIRGLGSDRVRVLVNGVGLIDASTASPDHAVASEALEARRIEILRGPAAIAYGGGAVGGVINVIDGRIPETAMTGDLEGRFYGSFNSVDAGETAAGLVGFGLGDFAFNLEMMTRKAADYDISGASESRALQEFELAETGNSGLEHGEARQVDNSGIQFDTSSFGVSLTGDWGYIGVGIKQTDALYDVPGGHGHEEAAPGAQPDMSPRIDLDQIRQDARAEFRFSTGVVERVKISAGAGHYEHTELEGSEIGTVFENDGWEVRAEARFRAADLWGGEWEGASGLQAFHRDFSALGDEAFVPPSQTSDIGLFFVERWDRENWGLEAGMRLERREIQSPAATIDFSSQSLSGSVFVRPRRDTFIALTLSSSERAPTDVELFADGPHVATQTWERGDASIGVERAMSLELTARTNVGAWELETALFAVDYDGFIVSIPTGTEIEHLPVFAYQQSDVTLRGFEVQAGGPLGRVASWDLSASVTGEFVRGELAGGASLPNMPPLSVTGRVEAEHDTHHLHVSLEWADVQNDTAVFEFKTPGYVLLGAGWTISPDWARDVRFIIEGRNLLDSEVRLHTSVLKDTVPMPGRSLRLAMVLNF